MPIKELHKQIALIALRIAAQHGFVLAGGNALMAHGITDRPTQDVDLFSNQEGAVEAAAAGVETALAAAGFTVERAAQDADLAYIFEGFGEGLAEWIVTAPSGEQVVVQLAYFERANWPVVMEVGPVLALEDAAGGKVAALASRAYERDYVDTAAMLAYYTPEQLISLAQRLDPGLEARDFADAGRRLDQLPDEAFIHLGLTAAAVAVLRERFAAWPRAASRA